MFCSLLTRCTIPCGCHAKRHLNVQKCSEPPQFFPLLTPTRASRHNGVHFFNISTSKSAPRQRCFVHFDFAMCFAPQRRALFRRLNFEKWSETVSILIFWLPNVLRPATACTFRHLNFKTCSEPGMFCTFWLRNVLRATTACNFSSLIWADGSAPAALASLYFSILRSHKSLEKHSDSRLFYLFAHLHLLSSDSFSLWSSLFCSSLLWLFSPLLFHMSTLSEVWLLNFLRVLYPHQSRHWGLSS